MTGLEMSDYWRNESSNKYLSATGDFNGDGAIDKAMLLVRKDGKVLGLFAVINGGSCDSTKYLLDEMVGDKFVHAMGIRIVPPGTYETACGKGYWSCTGEEVPEIELRHDSIDYFKTESANSFYYWDANYNVFKRIWISD